MNKQLASRFANQQLEQIIEEALIYMCACPAQVAEELLRLRRVFAYQINCISEGSLLDEVLALEGWDLQTLKMPEGLRKLREEKINQD
jgi:hypothetical protein